MNVIATPRSKTDHIIAECAREGGVTVMAIMGRDRSRRASEARHCAYSRLSHEAGLSTTQIGKRFGRDHSTVARGLEAHRGRASGERADGRRAGWESMPVADRIQKIKRLHREGNSRVKIAATLRIATRTLYRFMADHGLELPKIKPEGQNQTQTGVRNGWFIDTDSPKYREFVIAQDRAFQNRVKEVHA